MYLIERQSTKLQVKISNKSYNINWMSSIIFCCFLQKCIMFFSTIVRRIELDFSVCVCVFSLCIFYWVSFICLHLLSTHKKIKVSMQHYYYHYDKIYYNAFSTCRGRNRNRVIHKMNWILAFFSPSRFRLLLSFFFIPLVLSFRPNQLGLPS